MDIRLEWALWHGIPRFYPLGLEIKLFIREILGLNKILFKNLWDINKKFVDLNGLLMNRHWLRGAMIINYLFGISILINPWANFIIIKLL